MDMEVTRHILVQMSMVEKVVFGLSCASYIMVTSALYFTWWHELCAGRSAAAQTCFEPSDGEILFVDATEFSALYVVIRPPIPTRSAGL